MFGPEQVNVSVRPSPIFLEGTAPVRITEEMALQLGLKDNQTVRAVIENRGDLLRLILNQKDLDWNGSSKFKPGERIDFKVNFGTNGVTLTPIKTAPQTVSGPKQANTLPTGLISLMHRPSQPALLSNLLKPAALDSILAHLGARDWTQRLEQLKIPMRSITASGVKQALNNSGLFGEFFIASKQSQKPDLKQIMRGILRSIPDGVTLKTSLEQAVQELEGRQLDSLTSQNTREPSLQFTIPFTDAHPVDVELKKEVDSGDLEKFHWVINLHTDSEKLGEIWLKSKLLSDAEVEMTMWAVRESVASDAKFLSSELEYELKNFGLRMKGMTILNASRPEKESNSSNPGEVFDIKT